MKNNEVRTQNAESELRNGSLSKFSLCVLRSAFIVLLFASCAHRDVLRRPAEDVKAWATAPVHWSGHDWARFGEGVAVVGAVAAADEPISRAFQRNRNATTDRIAKDVTPWGARRALYVAAGLYGIGWLRHDDRMRDAGGDSFEAQVLSGITTGILKRLAGRARPNISDDAYIFRPGKSKNGGYQSFPSGHATNAFAAAAGIAGHYDGWIVPTIVYTVATTVAVARVNDHVHWPSDVVAGALIGRATARGLVWRHTHVAVVPIRDGVLFALR